LKTILGRLNETHLFADLEIWTSVTREIPAEKSRTEIKFGLTSERGVYAYYMGTKHNLPARLSQTLLQELLGVEV
jgi:hypothetical protein